MPRPLVRSLAMALGLLFALSPRSGLAAPISSTWAVPTITTLETWSDPTNWSPAGVPNDGGGDTYSVTIRTQNPSQDTFPTEAIVVDVPVMVTDLDVESATILLENDVSVSGQLRLGPDTVIKPAQGLVGVDPLITTSGTLVVPAGDPAGPGQGAVGTSVDWRNEGQMVLEPGADWFIGFRTGNGFFGDVYNAPTGTIELQGDASLRGPNRVFANDGLIRKTGTGSAVMPAGQLRGQIAVEEGELQIQTSVSFSSSDTLVLEADVDVAPTASLRILLDQSSNSDSFFRSTIRGGQSTVERRERRATLTPVVFFDGAVLDDHHMTLAPLSTAIPVTEFLVELPDLELRGGSTLEIHDRLVEVGSTTNVRDGGGGTNKIVIGPNAILRNTRVFPPGPATIGVEIELEGLFELPGRADLNVADVRQTAGLLSIDGRNLALGESVLNVQELRIEGGRTSLQNGVLVASEGVRVQGGRLTGDGIVTGDVIVESGRLEPGPQSRFFFDPLLVEGNVTLESAARLTLDGSSEGAALVAELLSVSGVLSLDGQLRVGWDGPIPGSGESVVIAEAAGGILGAFANAASGVRFDIDESMSAIAWYGLSSPFAPDEIVLANFAAIGVAEPLGLAVFGCGLALAACRRRDR